jgi:starch synthase
VKLPEAFRFKALWAGLQQRGMESDFSWEASAIAYEAIYIEAVQKE